MKQLRAVQGVKVKKVAGGLGKEMVNNQYFHSAFSLQGGCTNLSAPSSVKQMGAFLSVTFGSISHFISDFSSLNNL